MLISNKYEKRDANFELLRIISMFMFLILHYLSNCGFLDLNSGNYFIDNIPWLIEGICYIAVDCFILITGFFMYKSKLKISKILNLIIQVLFYSIIIYFIDVLFLKQPLDLKDILYAFIPVISGKYWFISNYIFLLLVSPFLNILIKNIDLKIHLFLCIVLTFVFSFLSTFFSYSSALKYEKSYDIVWFIVLYFVSSYFAKYGFSKIIKYKYLIYIISSLSVFGSKIVFDLLNRISIFNIIFSIFFCGNNKFGYTYSSIFVFISALFFFIIFKDINIKNIKFKKLINFTGSLVLTCYIIPNKYIWNFINPFNKIDNYLLIILYSIIVIILLFVFCCLIELVRKKIFDYIYNKIDFNKKCDLLQNKILNLF